MGVVIPVHNGLESHLVLQIHFPSAAFDSTQSTRSNLGLPFKPIFWYGVWLCRSGCPEI